MSSEQVRQKHRDKYIEFAKEAIQKGGLTARGVAKVAGKKLNEWTTENVTKKTIRRWTQELRDSSGAYDGPGADKISETKDSSSGELTNQERHLISLLPERESKIRDTLGIDAPMFRAIKDRLEEKDVKLKFDEDSDCWYMPDRPEKRRLSTKAKGTITREANEYRTEMEAAILRRLRAKPPLVASQNPHVGNEDMVVAIGDVHIGDVVEDSTGREVYNSHIAASSVEYFTKQALKLKRFQENLVDFDSCHLLWLGDIITGEHIYDGQAFDLDTLLSDQLSLAVEVFLRQAESLAEEFDTLQIVAVPGNHGEIRSGYDSSQANMDLVLYRWVCDRLIDRGHENINFLVGEATHHRNFKVRGGNHIFHVRHGQHESLHVDATARSEADWRGLIEKHRFDLAVRGHYHTYREETVLNKYPVITLPSPKPGSEFAERIGRPDCSRFRRLGAIWRASDNRVKTGGYVIDDQNMNINELDVPTIEEIRERSMQT